MAFHFSVLNMSFQNAAVIFLNMIISPLTHLLYLSTQAPVVLVLLDADYIWGVLGRGKEWGRKGKSSLGLQQVICMLRSTSSDFPEHFSS